MPAATSADSGEKRDVFRELSRGAVFITPGHGCNDGGITVIDFLIINAALSLASALPGGARELSIEVTFSR